MLKLELNYWRTFTFQVSHRQTKRPISPLTILIQLYRQDTPPTPHYRHSITAHKICKTLQ